jgi:hypothetical protein
MPFIQEILEELELNGTHQHLVYADNILKTEPFSVSDFHKTHPYVVSGSVDQTVKVWECR